MNAPVAGGEIGILFLADVPAGAQIRGAAFLSRNGVPVDVGAFLARLGGVHRGQKLVRLNVSFGGGLAVIEGARLFIEHEPGFEKVAGPFDVPVDRLAGAFAFGEHQAAPGVLAGGGAYPLADAVIPEVRPDLLLGQLRQYPRDEGVEVVGDGLGVEQHRHAVPGNAHPGLGKRRIRSAVQLYVVVFIPPHACVPTCKSPGCPANPSVQ